MLTIPAPWGTAPQVVGPSGHLGKLVFRHPFSDDGLVVQHEPEVDAWFDRYDNPQKDLVLAVRDVVLEADARVGECIKWQAPTFTYEGNIASFFRRPRSTCR